MPATADVDQIPVHLGTLMQPPTGSESLTEDYGEPSPGQRTLDGGIDYFSGLGIERQKKIRNDRPDPEKVPSTTINVELCINSLKPKISSRELNSQMLQGKTVDEYTPTAPKAATPGGPGSQWRMMKLRRVYETAEEEDKNVEEIALDRYGNLLAFEEAKEERRFLDEREGRRSDRDRGKQGERVRRSNEPEREQSGEARLMFMDAGSSGASSRSASFHRPGASTPTTPSPQVGPSMPRANRRLDSLRLPSDATKSPLSQSHTPIPSVMTPLVLTSKRRLSPASLNKMQAKVLRAKLMDLPDAVRLEKEYDEEMRKAPGSFSEVENTRVEMLPSLDGQGKLYDIGSGRDDGNKTAPGNRKKKEKVMLFAVSTRTMHTQSFASRLRCTTQQQVTLCDTMSMTTLRH